MEISKLQKLPDIICITEHWFKNLAPIPIKDYVCANFYSRDKKRGGGSSIYLRNSPGAPVILFSPCEELTKLAIESAFEISAVIIKKIDQWVPSAPFLIINIYSTPSCDTELFFHKLEELLSIIVKKKAHFLICGDFNINLLDKNCKESSYFLNMLSCHNLEPVFKNTPSRISKDSKTLIDNCISNFPISNAITFDPGLSDHRAQVISIEKKVIAVKSEKNRGYRSWTIVNKFNLRSLLIYCMSILMLCKDNVSLEFNKFNSLLYNAMETCCPIKPNMKDKRSRTFKYNDEILALSEKKKHLYEKYKNTGSKKFKKAWNVANKQCKKLLYTLKRNSNDLKLKNSKNKSKTVWNIIKEETERFQSPLIDIVESDGQIFTDPYDIANSFNKFFTGLASKFNANADIPAAMNLLRDTIPISTSLEFSFKPISLETLSTVIKDLKTNNQDTFGNIPTKLLIENFDVIGDPLLKLVNLCITEGVFPEFMKKGTVTPLFKKGNRKLVTNYRPITIIPTLAKVLEKILYNQLYSYFETNQLFDDHQFGFRKKKCTTQAIQKLVDNIYSAFENKSPIASIHFDLSKAFDTVDHSLLLYKLQHYGLNESSIMLIRSYLSNRFQSVKIETVDGPVFSETLNVNLGVPQGSCLGPLLFIIFINDLPGFLDALTFLFADDTSTTVRGEDVLTQLKTTYNQAHNWFKANGLSLNEDKTQLISYVPSKRVKQPTDLTYGNTFEIDDNTQLNFLESTNFLGVFLDQYLTWESHIDNIIRKLQKSKWAIRNLVKVASLSSALLYYHANVMSHIRYGIAVWGRSSFTKRVSKEHLKIIRIIYNKPYGSDCKEIMSSERLFTVTSLYIYECIKYAVEGEIIKPADLFPTHNYNSRHFFIPNNSTKYKISENSVKFASIQLFNALPLNIRLHFKNSEISKFFSHLKSFLLAESFQDLSEFFTTA